MNSVLSTWIFVGILFVTIVNSIDENKKIIRIVDSGSSNTAAYVIELEANGTVNLTIGSRPHPIIISSTPSIPTRTSISTDLVDILLKCTRQALPFDQYKSKFCMKSVSFGTILRVLYENEESPDLNCPLEDNRLISLKKVVKEVVSILHINALG